MTKDASSPPLPDAASTAVTNNKVSLALFAPPSPVSPALHWHAGVRNLFPDGAKTDTNKRVSNLPSTGYSPAKKKGSCRTHGAGMSPRDALDTCYAEAYIVPLRADVYRYFVWRLEPGAIAALEKQLTTKLDRTRLDKECRINQDNDAVSQLFSRVHHIYNRINVVRNWEQEVVGNSIPDNMKDVLDKVMDYEPSRNTPNMNDHIFDDEQEEDDADNDEQDMMQIDGFM